MNKKGFTLVELMIVVAIVAVLAAIAIPMYSKYIRKSRTSEAVSNLGAIALYEETYYSENDQYIIAGANPSGNPPSAADTGGRKLFNSSLDTGWTSLGNVIPNNTPLYFQYQILAGQINSAQVSVTSSTLVDYGSSTVPGGGYCTGNGSTFTNISASNLNIPNTKSSNWFYATAVGDQDADKTCSLFVKVIDRPDIVIENDVE
jgi:prepilin-type N-terminal cleavage/methylation domain-containing protein